MPTIATSENRPRYGHSPIWATSDARSLRIVTNTCAPRKITSPRISTARPIKADPVYQAHFQAGRTRSSPPGLDCQCGAAISRRIAFAAIEIVRGTDNRLALLERSHFGRHRSGAAVARDDAERALHRLDRGALRVARND